MLLLADIFTFLVYKNGLDVHTLDEDTLLKHVGKIIDPLIVYFKTAEDADIYEKFSRKFGEGGVIEYFDHLCSIIHAANPGFGSEEFLARLSKRNDQRVTQTHQDIIQLTQDVSDYVVQKLKDVYGTDEEESGEKAWWEQGIDSQKAKQTAYTRFQEGRKDNKKLPKEAYLDLLDYRDIVRQKNNWPHFGSVFNIPLPDEKGKTYYLDWMERLNKLRRVPAHPSGSRGYDESDYEFMKFIKYHFYKKLREATGTEEGDTE